jgi:small-conductance mechanosensitive channel
VADNAPVLLTGALLAACAYAAALEPSLSLFMLRLPVGVFLFGLGTVFIRWSTNTLSPAARVSGLAPEYTEPLRTRMRLCLMILVAGFVALGPGWLGNPPSAALLFLHTLLSLLLAGSLASLILLARRVAGLRRRFRLVRLAAVVTLIVSAGAGLLGFHNFANYLLLGVLKTLLAAFFLWLLLWMSSSAAEIVARGGSPLTYRWRAALGLTQGDTESGLGMYNLAVDVVLWVAFIYVVAVSWDTTGKLPDEVADLLVDGFPIGTVQFVPIHLIYGLVAFFAILIVTGWIKRAIQRRYIQRSQMDRGARDALIKITGYVGFTVALLVGLNFTGVSFAGLAVVGAALGVGIGFGLQNIVNNFVSGLILLFERPIKSGDFVTVGGVEGTVKQISIRSTEIETLDRQNVIVPNSELVSQQVTNWVLHDPHGRLQIIVGVAYGSDVEKVHDVLLEVAQNHPQVLTDGISSPRPKVLFREFGDSALIFELRIWIRQIRRRFDVSSEINFGIERAFRAAGIEIPFPQRDLHVRSWAPDARPPTASGPGREDA